MFALFRRRPLLSSETVDFQFDCFAWLLRHIKGIRHFRTRSLVQPTDRFFPQRGLHGHALAEALFGQTKELAGLGLWPCRLEAQEHDPNPLIAPTVVLRDAEQSPGGTFSWSKERGAVVTYAPSKLEEPMSLVATFAHELAHYRTSYFANPPPGGWDNWEFATDIGAVFLGFGIFMANSRFSFSQYTGTYSQGWQTLRQGYLSQPEILHAQAIFSALLPAPHGDVLPHLKPSLRGMYKKMCRAVAAQPERLRQLEAVEPWVEADREDAV